MTGLRILVLVSSLVLPGLGQQRVYLERGTGWGGFATLNSRLSRSLPRGFAMGKTWNAGDGVRPDGRQANALFVVEGTAAWRRLDAALRPRALLLLAPGEKAPEDARSGVRVPDARPRLWRVLETQLPGRSWAVFANPRPFDRSARALVVPKDAAKDPLAALRRLRAQIRGVVIEDGALDARRVEVVLRWCATERLPIASDAPELVRDEVVLSVAPDAERLALLLAEQLRRLARRETTRLRSPRFVRSSLHLGLLARYGIEAKAERLALLDALRGHLGEARR